MLTKNGTAALRVSFKHGMCGHRTPHERSIFNVLQISRHTQLRTMIISLFGNLLV